MYLNFGVVIMTLMFIFLDPTIPFPKFYPTETLKQVHEVMGKKMCGKIICSHAKFKIMQMVLIGD